MKKTVAILALLAFLFMGTKVSARDYGRQINDIAQEYNIDAERVTDITPKDVMDYIVNAVKEQAQRPIKLCMKSIAVILLCALVKSFESGAGQNTITDSVCTVMVFLNLLTPIGQAVKMVAENLESIKTFMSSFLPIYAGISMASGEFTTSAVYSGFFLMSLIFMANFSLGTVLPSMQMYFALIISNALSPYIKLQSICDFYTKAVKWVMRTMVSVICLILTLQTTISQGADNLAVKAGKALAGTAVPVIGSVLQDAVGSVYASMEAIKGFAGAVGILVIVYIFLPAFITLAVYWVCTQLMYIVCDMFDVKSVKSCVSGFTNIVELMMSLVVLFMIMLIFSLTIMISLTNGV